MSDFHPLALLIATDQLDRCLADVDDGPVIARDTGPLGPRAWTANRVWCANVEETHIASMPRNPPGQDHDTVQSQLDDANRRIAAAELALTQAHPSYGRLVDPVRAALRGDS